MSYKFLLSILILLMVSCVRDGQDKKEQIQKEETTEAAPDSLRYPDEKHLKNIRQLTFGGENAEAYFSFDDRMLVFQRTHEPEAPCDQIYWSTIPLADGGRDSLQFNLISQSRGRTTCAYFLPGNQEVIFASTHLDGVGCPSIPVGGEGKYVWPIFPEYEIFSADLQGNILKQFTDNDAYDAEATVSPKGDKIVFTSTRNGDLDLYTMNIDGSDVQQITTGLGYDGGAFFSPDGSKLVFRSSRPKTEAEVNEYKSLLAQNLVAPTNMELYVCNTDGSNLRQVTTLGNANWAPFFHPSGEKIIFSSNHTSQRGFPFNLYMIKIDGTGLEQITFDGMFDAFPMFSFDGRYLVWSSNRNNKGTRDTNIFMAEWVE